MTGGDARPTDAIATTTQTKTACTFFTLLWTHQNSQPLRFVGTGIVRKRPIRVSAALISNAYVGSITSAPVINREERLFR